MKDLRTEDEIIANWKGDIDKPVVSICCITYNHEPYIEDALKGFLIQETDFPFEILIHDDASTDRTADIIREYEAKYPRLIKPIYQVENQYSQGVKISAKFNFPRSQGKYIALCEGDDYWVDKYKLKKQYKTLSENKKIDLVVHDASICDTNRATLQKNWSGNYFKNEIISVKKVFTVHGQFAPTASYFFRNKNLELLSAFKEAPIGDLLIEIILGRNGIYAMSDIMSAYRTNVSGSWSINEFNKFESRVKYCNSMLITFERMRILMPNEIVRLIPYKEKAVYHDLAMTYSSVDKIYSIKYFLKSIDLKSFKIKRIAIYLRKLIVLI